MPPPRPRAGTPVALADTVALPAPLGTTPFRVKGHVYQKMRGNIEETAAGGLAALLDQLEDPTVREFFQQRFVAGGWYDALPMMPITRVHARLCGSGFHAHCRDRGGTVAADDVPGVYRAILRLFSPETLVTRLPRVATFYFSFGHATSEQPEPGRGATTLHGIPYTLAPYLAGVVEGFTAKALELSGAREVTVRTLEVAYDGGAVANVATAAIRHESTWQV